jgi:hypothetical protein
MMRMISICGGACVCHSQSVAAWLGVPLAPLAAPLADALSKLPGATRTQGWCRLLSHSALPGLLTGSIISVGMLVRAPVVEESITDAVTGSATGTMSPLAVDAVRSVLKDDKLLLTDDAPASKGLRGAGPAKLNDCMRVSSTLNDGAGSCMTAHSRRSQRVATAQSTTPSQCFLARFFVAVHTPYAAGRVGLLCHARSVHERVCLHMWTNGTTAEAWRCCDSCRLVLLCSP